MKLQSTYNLPTAIGLGGMRATGLLSKFFLLTFLANKLNSESLGSFVFLSGVITYAIFIAGLEFYNVSLRSYVASKFDINNLSLRSHITYSVRLSSFAFLLVGCYILFKHFIIDVFVYVGIIWLIEYLTEEFGRFAIFRDEQVVSNFIRFIKTAGWIIPFIILFWDSTEIALTTVMRWWVTGSFCSLVFCVFFYAPVIRGLLRIKFFKSELFAWPDLIKKLIPFLIISFCYRTPVVLDKVLVGYFGSIDLVGWYGYYYNFAYGSQALFDVMIMAWFVPRSIALKDQNGSLFKIANNYLLLTLAFFLVLGVAFVFLVPLMTELMSVSFVNDGFSLLIISMMAQCFFSMASICGLVLYAKDADYELTVSSALYLLTFLFLALPFIVIFGVIGVAWSLLGASLALFIGRLLQVGRVLSWGEISNDRNS